MGSEAANPIGEAAMVQFGKDFAPTLGAGDLVLLSGELGAGKTTLVRGILEALGWAGPVRSPTFNLIQTFDTNPPVMHADLYRLESSRGIGLEEYLDDYLCLVEWPDRLTDELRESAIQVHIEFEGQGRRVSVHRP